MFVVECARELGLRGRWGFSWSNNCNTSFVDCFGGGAQVIDLETGNTDNRMHTIEWLNQQLADDADDWL